MLHRALTGPAYTSNTGGRDTSLLRQEVRVWTHLHPFLLDLVFRTMPQMLLMSKVMGRRWNYLSLMVVIHVYGKITAKIIFSSGGHQLIFGFSMRQRVLTV